MEFLYPLMPRSNLRDTHDILLRSIGKEEVKLQNHLESIPFPWTCWGILSGTHAPERGLYCGMPYFMSHKSNWTDCNHKLMTYLRKEKYTCNPSLALSCDVNYVKKC